MWFPVFFASLSFAASALADNNPPQPPIISLVSSETPSQCSPGKSISISFSEDLGNLTTNLSGVQLQSADHGRAEKYASCDFKVELSSWYYKYRVGISGATIKGHASLTDGMQINKFNTTAVFRLEHLKNSRPIKPPEITNLSMSTMFNELTTKNIGGEGNYDDDFEVDIKASSSQTIWSPCFEGDEGGSQDSTYIDFFVSALGSDTTGKGTGKLSTGLIVDWDLVWEQCTPDWNEMYSWGEVRVENWQSCTYSSENNLSIL